MILSRMHTPLEKAVLAAGGQSHLARALSTEPGKVKQGHVWAWLNRDKKAPVEHCPAIEVLTGIRCEELRPDIVWTRDISGQITGYHVQLAAA